MKKKEIKTEAKKEEKKEDFKSIPQLRDFLMRFISLYGIENVNKELENINKSLD